MTSATTTTDHDRIRKWIEERDGRPSRVKAAGGDGGLLRVDFDEPGGDNDADDLEEIGWDAFFDTFDKNGLAFLHQDQTEEGKISRFNKFIDRANAG